MPAVVLSRNDAAAFCRWVSEQTGRTCRLPTEAEWEYAARAGRQDDPAGGLKDVAWYEDNTSNSPYAVATKAANPWGLYDMQGNAWEWCLDVWRPDYQRCRARRQCPDERPHNPSGGMALRAARRRLGQSGGSPSIWPPVPRPRIVRQPGDRIPNRPVRTLTLFCHPERSG